MKTKQLNKCRWQVNSMTYASQEGFSIRRSFNCAATGLYPTLSEGMISSGISQFVDRYFDSIICKEASRTCFFITTNYFMDCI